jgi:hypothetical protein
LRVDFLLTRTGGFPAMYRVRGNHAADHHPACLLLP